MGMFKVRVRVTNPSDASRFFEDEFWVDTGPCIRSRPRSASRGIGIDPALSRDVILADGRQARVPSYTAWWLRRHPVLRGRRPGELCLPGADEPGAMRLVHTPAFGHTIRIIDQRAA